MMWFFFVAAILIYIWPGHMSAGAAAFEELTGIPWQVAACVALVFVGVLFSLLSVIYNFLEKLLGFLIGLLVIGTSVDRGASSAAGATWPTPSHGMFAFGYFPDKALTAAWFPIVVGSIAFAGPSGMQQMWYTLQLRDSGAGMGAHIPKIRGLRTPRARSRRCPSRGYMFDTEDPEEMKKWKGWRKWVTFDALLLFWGITMLVTISFTVLALSAARENPDVAGADRGR